MIWRLRELRALHGRLPPIVRQFLAFLPIGGVAAAFSFAAYIALVLAGFHTALANAASFVMGATISFVLNRIFTFASPRGGMGRLAAFIGLYLVTLGVQVGLNEGLLAIFGKANPMAITGCWCAAVGVSSILNFLGMKFLVFRA